MWEGLAECPGWERGEAQGNHSTGGPHGPLPAVQLLLILNSWHIMGTQALAAFGWEAEISGRPPSRAWLQCGSQRSAPRGGLLERHESNSTGAHATGRSDDRSTPQRFCFFLPLARI